MVLELYTAIGNANASRQRMKPNTASQTMKLMHTLVTTLGTTRLRGRPRNRWEDEVREDVSIVAGEGWQEKVPNREEWKKLLRTARYCRILHTPME